MPKVKKEDLYRKAEHIAKGFDYIPMFLENELGLNFKCPKCKNGLHFQVILDTSLLAANCILDHLNKIWRVEKPSVNITGIQTIKCLECGYKEKVDIFKNGQINTTETENK